MKGIIKVYEVMEENDRLKAENKKLRRLLELTKRYCIQFDGCQEMDDDCSHECEDDCPFMLIETCRNIRKTITELDKEGDGC